MKFKRDFLRPGYDFNAPTFILDQNFQYVDWNYAFDEIFGKEYGLKLGMHGTYIDQFLVNCEELSERTARVFSEGAHPLMDTEPVVLRTERFGVVHCQKLAAQIIDENGQKVAWVVTLNIVRADRLDLLWEVLMNRFEKEVMWSSLSSLRELHWRQHPDHEALQKTLASWLGGGVSTLLVGAPAPLVLPLGLKNAIIEPNHQSWERTRAALGAEAAAQVVKTRFDLLADFQGSRFERILISDLALRAEHPEKIWDAVKSIVDARTEIAILSSDLSRERALVASLLSGEAKLNYEETLNRYAAKEWSHSGESQTFLSGTVTLTHLRKK